MVTKGYTNYGKGKVVGAYSILEQNIARRHSSMNNERKFFVHMFGALILGVDVFLDYVQIGFYWSYGKQTSDLFTASLIMMGVTPSILAFYLSCIFTDAKIKYLYKGVCGEGTEDFLSALLNISGITLVLGGPLCGGFLGHMSLLLSFTADIATFALLFAFFFPLMVVSVTFAPITGLFIGWRDMAENDLKRYYFVRYLNGAFEAFPQALINIIFMARIGASGPSIASLVFSLLSLAQVIHQAFGMGKYYCCTDTTCEVFSGTGTIFNTMA